MQIFPPTVILRHQRENLKKCSLRGLENRPDFQFYTYPKDLLNQILPDLTGYILLTVDGTPLEESDKNRGIFLLDGTWALADQMGKQVLKSTKGLVFRALPQKYKTAYPRYQTKCSLPDQGLASVEALYAIYRELGRDCTGLLDNYYWKNTFLTTNY